MRISFASFPIFLHSDYLGLVGFYMKSAILILTGLTAYLILAFTINKSSVIMFKSGAWIL